MQNTNDDDKPIAAYELNYVHNGKQLSNVTKFYRTDDGIMKSFNLGGDGVCRDVLSHTTEKDMMAEFRNVVKSSENYSVLSFPTGFTMTEADFKSNDSKINVYQDMMADFNEFQHKHISGRDPYDALNLVTAIDQYRRAESNNVLTRDQHNTASYELSRCIALSKAAYESSDFKQMCRTCDLPEGEMIAQYASNICSRITDKDNGLDKCHDYMAKFLNLSSSIADKAFNIQDKTKFFDTYCSVTKSVGFAKESLHDKKMNSLHKEMPKRDIMSIDDSASDEFETTIRFGQ